MDPRGSQQDDDVVDDSQPGKTTMVDVNITGCHIYTELLRMSQIACSMKNFVNLCMLQLMSIFLLKPIRVLAPRVCASLTQSLGRPLA